MATFDQLLDQVMPEVKGSPPLALVQLKIKDAVIDFIQRSRLIRKTTGLLDWPAGSGERALDNATFNSLLVSNQERVLQVDEAWWKGERLTPMTPEELELDYGPNWMTLTGTPGAWTRENDGLRLVPEPGANAQSLRVRIRVGLLDTATTFPDRVYNEHKLYLAMGAKAGLFYMSQKPWSDPLLADVNYRQFISRAASARLKADRTPIKAPLVTTPHGF